MNQNILVNQIVNFKGKKEKIIKEVLLVLAGVVFLTLTAYTTGTVLFVSNT